MDEIQKNIPVPSSVEINLYLAKWSSLENYVLQENSLKKLFIETYPENKEMDDILIKVCSLNDFYSTSIFSPFIIAKHIRNLQIDQRLSDADETLVNDIATGHGIGRNFYSFATKYCSHHQPKAYPIFDSFVEKMLLHFKKTNNSFDFDKKDLRDYSKYKELLKKFTAIYGLEEFTFKDIDKYLWQAGKYYFGKTYAKQSKKGLEKIL